MIVLPRPLEPLCWEDNLLVLLVLLVPGPSPCIILVPLPYLLAPANPKVWDKLGLANELLGLRRCEYKPMGLAGQAGRANL